MLKTEVYDIETLSNLFTYTSYVIEEDKWYQFVIHKDRNQSIELYNHLLRGDFFQVGFNNERFDYLVIHHFLDHFNEYISADILAKDLYHKAQEIINDDNQFKSIYDKNKYILQIDLFLIHHYNNKNKRTSLKDVEFALRLPNIEEMPIHHSKYCFEEDIDTILAYNKNDVYATYMFYKSTLGETDNIVYKGKNKLKLRLDFKKKFKINCLNWPDAKIGENLVLKLYCQKNNLDLQKIKQLKTPRERIHLKDCIPYWCDFESKEFQSLLSDIKKTSVNPLNFDFERSVLFNGIQLDIKGGGIHNVPKSGIYIPLEDEVILSQDIGSMYPSIARSLGIYPEHLGPEFNKTYCEFIDVRLNEKRKKENKDNALIEGCKLLLNCVYGKSNDEKSPLYDPLYTFKTTIAGQIFACMWIEQLTLNIPDIKFILCNTDGTEVIIKKCYLNKLFDINKQLEEKTGLSIDYDYYNKLIVRDINNYIAEYSDSTKENPHLKLKGCFEIDKEFHKDSSHRIIPIALKEYFINNISIEETIINHKDIYDFCIRLKINSKTKAYYNYLNNNKIQKMQLTRTTRYYCSNSGGSLSVHYNGGSQTLLNKGYSFKLFNNYYQSDNYDINYNFYITEANKIANVIENKQLTLF